MSTTPSLAEQLRARRGALGLTQAELAERARISERAVSDMERGLRRVVYRETARRLLVALELTGDDAARFEAAARGRPASARLPSRAATPAQGPLVGRSAELAEVAALLEDPSTRLLTLTGPGGVGKTRLAVELMAALEESFGGGVAFVPLADLRDPGLVLHAIAGTLRVRAPDDLAAELAAYLSSRRMLLVLDTFEHLLGAAPALAEVVANLTVSKVLVTSRASLNVRAERLFQVGPLPAADAIAMFASCLRRREPSLGARLDRELVAGLCTRLDGLPLAIELAAARARLLGLAEISAHLERRLPMLDDGPVDLPARQQSMSATIAWSYDLLNSADRRLIEELSTFAGGWTRQAATAVCSLNGDVLVGLGRLVDSSLVLLEAGDRETRFRMLDTVREYAAGRLQERLDALEVASLRRRHAQFFRALAEEAEPHLRGAGQQESGGRLSAEHDNLRAALGWAIAIHDSETALRLGGALWMFWRLTGAFSEGRVWLRQVLDMDAGGIEHLRAGALWGAGWLAYQQGDFRETARHAAELEEWARRAGDAGALRNGLTLLGEERMSAGDFAAASRRLDEALALARGLPSPWLAATSCLNRAVAALHLGDLHQADALMNEAERVYGELGDDRFVARVWLQRAYAALLQDQVNRAREIVTAGLARALELDDGWAVAEQLDALGAVLAASGDAHRAAFVAGAAATAWERIGAEAHPADRRSSSRWLEPVAASARDEWRAGFAAGGSADVEALSRTVGLSLPRPG